MHKILFSFLALLLLVKSNVSFSQECCAKPGTMQALAMNIDFRAAHEPPLPLSYSPEGGQMITFPTADGKTGSSFYLPSKKTTNKVLIVFHEWWGLNDYIKREAENLQKALGDIDVYAVDLYDGQVATDADAAGKLAGGLKDDRGMAIVNGLVKHIGSGKRIGTIGWCMGGTWSFNGTLAAGNEAAACVMYYGFPGQDMKRIRTLKTDVLYIRGTEDKYIDGKSVETFGKNVTATGHHYTQKDYKADHAFANPSNPHYNEQATKEAMAISITFLKKGLGL